ncbi:hypothetical protein F5141DRAFT_1074742 [Pisolithus sp. B1]|nr:hypothetical protein F5141DRAFT_1074742 [Pisolithus sp. B1]
MNCKHFVPVKPGRRGAHPSLPCCTLHHKHESGTGRTPSISMEITRFTASGVTVLLGQIGVQDPDTVRLDKLGWANIIAPSAKIISFSAMLSHSPD